MVTTNIMIKRQVIAAIAGLFSVFSASAHHSAAAFDTAKEVVIEGTVTELEWQNPHIYLTLKTTAADGRTLLQRVEVGPLSSVQTFGLKREAVAPGSRIAVRANPNRRPGQTVRGLDVTTSDGVVYALVAIGRNSSGPEVTVPAQGLAGSWAAQAVALRGFGAAIASWPFAAAVQAARTEAMKSTVFLGVCEPFPPPGLVVLPGLRTIAISDKSAVMHFDAEGQDIERVVHLDQTKHPADVTPTVQGHSIGHFEGDTLVVDTIGFARHPNGVTTGVASGPKKHMVERLALTEDRLHLRYEFTMEDADSLTAPVSYSMLWDHRPDMTPSGVACDPNIARRFLDDAAPR
jgi:uncharacterized protein DUF6152